MNVLARLILGIGSCVALATPSCAEYPDKPIRYIVHVSPGGATDVMARKLGNGLQQILGQPVVIENRPGGRGAAEMAELKVAKPDGYTIGTVTNTHIAAFHQTLKQYDIDSVDWLAKLVEEPYLIVVRHDSPIRNVKDLIQTIKAAPGKTVIAGFTRGSGLHTAWEMLMKAGGVPHDAANWVPYDSAGDSVTALLGSHGIATVAYVDLVKDHVEAGNLRVIGVMANKRLAQFPDVPTLTEQGFDMPSEWEQWRGIIGPKGMPDDVKEKLADAIQNCLKDADMQTYLKAGSLEPSFVGPHEFKRFAEDQDKITVDWLKTLGFLK
jgi:tripartite-type tricarboxylate transporter receptor subunit TctC